MQSPDLFLTNTGRLHIAIEWATGPSTSAPTGLTHIKAQSALIAPSLTWVSWNLVLMASDRIRKRLADCVGANLQDYEEAARTFSWVQARAMLTGLPRGGLNIAHEAVDRHVGAGHGERLALRWIGRDDQVRDFTYAVLHRETNRFASLLAHLAVARGDRVFSLLSRVPELYLSALGTLKYGGVFSPLFSAFGPEPIRTRMAIGQARVLITSEALYRRKVEPWRKELASLKHVLLTDVSNTLPAGTMDLTAAMAAASDSFEIVPTTAEDMALLHFTSGTTGRPKGSVHVHEAVVAHHITGRLALDLHPEDIFWCTADPGWVTGTSYGIISPLSNGATLIVDQAEFDAERWYLCRIRGSPSGTRHPLRSACS
jgi:acetyl-CoA synthetase